ncbi:MAG: hypothetical protein IH614_19620 [Desulfuromonadales bacterium]|nr:hypothetical protein [Desulfuromonadales bacterium]
MKGKGIFVLAAAVAVFGWLPAVSALAMETTIRQATGSPFLPSEIGEVIFQIPGQDDRHIFIIGHSHRSARTGANGNYTIRAQAEVYRIGEWLIRKENVQLLLPEGFFKRRPTAEVVAGAPAKGALVQTAALDHQVLVEKLSDTSVFVNADMLLRANYQIQLHQVEDAEIYQAVSRFLHLADDMRDTHLAGLLDLELDFLQEVRSAAMLQNIPDAVEFELQTGNIDNRRAMFTVGMAHVDEIIRFLREGQIAISPPSMTFDSYQEHRALLKLIKEGYGVTVILPRSLVDNQEALRLANLNNI